MKAKEIEFGGLNLELRLDGDAIFRIEKSLGEGIQGLFVKGEGEIRIPPANKLLIVLHGANKKSGITQKMMLEAFKKFIDEGRNTMELFAIVAELASGTGFGDTQDEDSILELETDTEENVL